MHQSTVSRSLNLLQRELELRPGAGPGVCRHGHNSTLEQLRLAYRCYRVMKGVLRIGTDGLHQTLLARGPGLQPVPAQFRSHREWVELVRHGLLDGAIVSSLGLDKARTCATLPRWSGIQVEPLGELTLQLLANAMEADGILLPRRGVAPLLHQALCRDGHRVEVVPGTCLEPEVWVERLTTRPLAAPLLAGFTAAGWMSRHGLRPLARQPELVEQLWLLLPQGPLSGSPLAQRWIRRLRRRVSAAAARPGTSEG
jgi:hypothetical protein